MMPLAEDFRPYLIYFTINEAYLPHLYAALMSFVDHHSSSEFRIAILHDGIDMYKLYELIEFFSDKNLDIAEYNMGVLYSGFEVGYHFSNIIFYRFLAPEMFKEYDKIIYIDSDVLFLGSITSLFRIDLSGKILAAVDTSQFFGIPYHLVGEIDRYLASGLMVINCENFLKYSVRSKCEKFLLEHAYKMPDQDALSFVVKDFVPLDPLFSFESAFLNNSMLGADSISKAKIIQFSGRSKPWHLKNVHPCKSLYWFYRNQTPCKSSLADDFGLQSLVSCILPKSIKKIIMHFLG